MFASLDVLFCIMKNTFGLWSLVLVLFFLVGVSSSRKASMIPDMLVNQRGDGLKFTTTMRSLKGVRGFNHRHTGKVKLDDYHPIDPSPSSKASIRPGPIEHNAPLIPYIPKPSLPPPHPPSPSASP